MWPNYQEKRKIIVVYSLSLKTHRIWSFRVVALHRAAKNTSKCRTRVQIDSFGELNLLFNNTMPQTSWFLKVPFNYWGILFCIYSTKGRLLKRARRIKKNNNTRFCVDHRKKNSINFHLHCSSKIVGSSPVLTDFGTFTSVRIILFKTQHCKKKGKVAHEPKRPTWPERIPVSVAWSNWEYCYSPWMGC